MLKQKKEVYTDKTLHSGAQYSQAIVSDDLVFVSGQVPVDPKTKKVIGNTVYEQTTAVLNFIKLILEEVDCTMEDILKLNCYLTDLNDFSEMNRAFESFFDKPYPARTTVGVQLIGFHVEMECVARLRSNEADDV